MKSLIYFILVSGAALWAAFGFVYLIIDEFFYRRAKVRVGKKRDHFRATERFRNEVS